MCGKYPCACTRIMLGSILFSLVCGADVSISPSSRKKKHFGPCACASGCVYAFVEAVFTVK